MIDELLKQIAPKDWAIVLVFLIAWYWRSTEALRLAKAAMKRNDELREEVHGKDQIRDRLTRLEEQNRGQAAAMKRIGANAHKGINTAAALVGYVEHAIDIVGDGIGKKLPKPRLPRAFKLDEEDDE